MSRFNTEWLLELKDKVSGSLGKIGDSFSSAEKKLLSVANGTAKLQGGFDKLAMRAFQMNQVGTAMENVKTSIDGAIEPGKKFDTSLKNLSALTETTGKKLDDMANSAQRTAKMFGSDAAGEVENMKMLLSRLGPDISQSIPALENMDKAVNILGKTMGGNVAGATDALTTAMLQFGVDLSKPTEAATSMWSMMNVMAAAAQKGAAEIPQIKEALEVAGVAASGAKVSFEETNSAIQALAQGGKYGSEAGTALRNVMSKLGQGRFLPKDTRAALASAGVDINKLSNTSLSFTDRLRELQKIGKDSALITHLFGEENSAAAQILLRSIGYQEDMTRSITGTNSAADQARTVMSSYEEQQKRADAAVADLKISLFNLTRGQLPFIENTMKAGVEVLRLAPAFEVAIKGGNWLTGVLADGAAKSLGFAKTMGVMGLSALKTGASFIWTAITGLGGFIVSMANATLAQIGLNIAMSANPIGLIVIGLLAVGAAIAALIMNWDTVKAYLIQFGEWAMQHHPFMWLVNLVDNVFPGFKEKVKEVFSTIMGWFKGLWDGIKDVWNSLTGVLGGVKMPDNVFAMTAMTDNAAGSTKQDDKKPGSTQSDSLGLSNGLSSVSGAEGTGGQVRNVRVTIQKMQIAESIAFSNVAEGVGSLKGKLMDLLVRELRDAEIALTAG